MSGHGLRAAAEGEAHDEAGPHEGVLPEVVEWLWQRAWPSIPATASSSARALRSDPMPLHQIGLARMGLWILDCPDLETLADAAASRPESTSS